MMSKIQVVPVKTPIPPDSIIFTSCKSFEKLAAPDTQPEEIATLAALFKVAIDTRSAARQLPLSVSEKHINELEFIHYWTLLLFTHYLTLNAQHQPDAQRIQLWMEKYEFIQRYIENYERKYITEHLAFYKISTLLCAIKSHVDILSGKKTSAVLLSVYHFACTLQEYRNYAAILGRTKGFQESVLTQEASPLFYDDQRNSPFNGWCKVVTQAINRTIGHIMTHEEYSEHEIKFLEYTVGCISEKKPVNPNFPKHIEQFDFPGFQKNILAEGITQLLSTKKSTDNTVLAQSLVFAQIKFLHTQFLHPEMSKFFGATIAADTFLRNAMPFLFIYLYFIPCFDLNFLGTHAAAYTDVTEDGRIMQFLQRIGAAIEPFHFEKLVELTNTFENNAVRHILIYLLLDRAQESTLLRQALRKLKIHKFTEPLLKQPVETLEYIFGPRSQEAKIQSIKNYLILAEKNLDHWKTLSFSISLLLICKKALELKNDDLSARVTDVLEKFECAVLGKAPPAKPQPSEDSPQETLKSLELLTKSKPAKKKKNKKKKKPGRKPQATVVTASAEIFEETVTVESFKVVESKPQREPRPPSPISTTPSSEEENVPVIVQSPPTISLKNYLKQGKQTFVENISEQTEHAKVKTHSGFNPLQPLMTCFNQNTTAENKYKHALFLFGSAQLRQKYFEYEVRAKDLDLYTNCTLPELNVFLETNKSFLKIAEIKPIWGKHPLVKVTFEEHPELTVDITPMRDETTGKITLRKLIRKLQIQADFSPNAIFSTLIDDEEIFIDTQGGRLLLSQRNRELKLVTPHHTDDTIPTMILRTVRFLAKCPDFTRHPTLTNWIEENKASLSTQKDAPQALLVSHAFVKLLYSGNAARSLELLKAFGLLEILCPELDKRIVEPDFIAWVERFDRNESGKYQLDARENYRSVCKNTLNVFGIKLDALDVFLSGPTKWRSMSNLLQQEAKKNPCYTPVTSTQGTITWTMQPK